MTNPNWSWETLILYLISITIPVIFATLSYKKIKFESAELIEFRINKLLYALSFASAWPLLAFATCGADYPVYRMMFIRATDLSVLRFNYRIELLYAVFNWIIRSFTDNENIFFGIVAFLFLFFVYHGIYKMKGVIHPGWGIFVFTTMFYLQQLNLKRIYLSAAIVFWATSYLIEKKYIKYAVSIFASVFIHTSSIIMIIPLLYDLFINKKLNKKIVLLLSLGSIVVLYLLRNSIASMAISERYVNYGAQRGGLGIVQLAYHAPIFYLLMKRKMDSDKFSRYIEIGFVNIALSFIIGMAGYFVVMIGRAFVYFMYPFILSASLNGNTSPKKKMFIVSNRDLWRIVIVFYCILRFIMYLSEYQYSDAIMPYTNIFEVSF